MFVEHRAIYLLVDAICFCMLCTFALAVSVPDLYRRIHFLYYTKKTKSTSIDLNDPQPICQSTLLIYSVINCVWVDFFHVANHTIIWTWRTWGHAPDKEWVSKSRAPETICLRNWRHAGVVCAGLCQDTMGSPGFNNWLNDSCVRIGVVEI